MKPKCWTITSANVWYLNCRLIFTFIHCESLFFNSESAYISSRSAKLFIQIWMQHEKSQMNRNCYIVLSFKGFVKFDIRIEFIYGNDPLITSNTPMQYICTPSHHTGVDFNFGYILQWFIIHLILYKNSMKNETPLLTRKKLHLYVMMDLYTM